jgi:poly(glycerol-phosphate) alpha-glucosyltransferase
VFAARDSDSTKDLAAWRMLPVHLSGSRGPTRFSYAPNLGESLDASNLDLLASHGLWRYTSIAASKWHAQTKRPYIVSPHGMLDKWAVRNSAFKKRIAWRAFEYRHLLEATCIRALCEAETRAIRERGLKNPVAVIPNGIDPPPAVFQDVPPPWTQVPGFAGVKVALSLGRLHPKKNLIALLQAWRSLVESTGQRSTEWGLVIAGWDEAGHAAELKQCAKELGLAQLVWFAGPLYGAAKDSAYRGASAFVIPSLSEGLPMVVLEAWSYGVPVVMTAECNLPEGFAAAAALQITPGPASIHEGLTTLVAMNDAEREAMGRRGKALTEQQFSWERVGRDMAGLLSWVIEEGPRPDHVSAE